MKGLNVILVMLVLVIGAVALAITSSREMSAPSISAGEPNTKIQLVQWSSGTFSFPSLQEIPIHVSCQSASNLTFSASSVPPQAWVDFEPESLTGVGTNGGTTTLFLAGIAVPPLHTSGYPNMTVVATGCPSGPLTLDLQYGVIVNVATINSTGPIGLSTVNPATADQNNTALFTFGIVYRGPEGSLPVTASVSFSILGLDANGTLTPLPDWLDASFLNSSFALAPLTPTYLTLQVVTHSAPVGDYSIAVAENLNGLTYSVDFDFSVVPPTHS